MDAALRALREEAKKGRDPACADETLDYLLHTAETLHALRFLEIGAGEGLTSVAFFLKTGGDFVAIEKDPSRAARARENFRRFGCGAHATLLEGDAGKLLPLLSGKFDLIFLDGPKAQYRRYLFDCKRLLREGGVLLSDDVLLFGWVRGEPPKKRRMLAEHLREYLGMLSSDPELSTKVLELGEGLAVSQKIAPEHKEES